MRYYEQTPEEVCEKLNTNVNGLSEEEAQARLTQYGQNVIEEGKKESAFKFFLAQFNDMMIIILLIVAVFMGIYGFFYSHDYVDTIVILVVVFINAIMGFVQEEKARVTLDGLKKYATVKCKVRRAGHVSIVDTKLLVPGDIIILEAGDKVPVDARIIMESNVMTDESPLTGESVPVKKSNMVLSGTLPLQDQVNMVFAGSSITNGHLEAIVCQTGMTTELGLIAVSLNTPYKVDTPLQLKIAEISKKLTLVIFFILIFMFIYGVINHYKIMEIIMLCVSLAVAAIPEGLPAVITISLSTGAGALAKKKTIVRHMIAVETLGSTDIICSDKTGTITQNKMTVKDSSFYDKLMGCNIALLCNDALIEAGNYLGDPTETSLLSYYASELDIADFMENHPRLVDAPFDSSRKMMSTVNEIEGKYYLLTKGSLENLLKECRNIKIDNMVKPLTDALRKQILAEETSYAKRALRVIGFAYRPLENVPTNATEVLALEHDLVYVGLVGIIDPPRDDVKAAVQKCFVAGIRPIMITGDSLQTACAIAKEVGIIEDESEGILGSELDNLSDEEFSQVIANYHVYARVSPEHKTRIVKIWQSLGKVVAMTGDGVNDAPAIKDAHVGVGMGITGTEVTKSVADVILLDDSFSTIVTAVEEGRRIYTNIRNNVVYSLSSNFAEIFVVLIGMLTGYSILLPIQILFIDLITDSIPSICLAFEKSEKGIMDKPPRGINKPIFTPFLMANIASSAIIETIFVLVTFFTALRMFDVQTAASLALLSMVLQELIYAISCRNLKMPIYKHGFLSNKPFIIGFIVLIMVEALVFLTPLGTFIDIVSIKSNILISIIIFNLLAFLIYEAIKPLLVKCFND